MEPGVMKRASLILKALRLGRVARERVELAALVGEPSALVALGDDAPEIEPEFKRWARQLDRYGHEVSARIGAALGEALLPVLEQDGLGGGALRRAVEIGRQGLQGVVDVEEARRVYGEAMGEAVEASDDRAETAALIAAFAALGWVEHVPAVDLAADAADVLGEVEVRRRIQRVIGPWALSSIG